MNKRSPSFDNDDELIVYLEKNFVKKEPLNPDQLMQYPGCENYTDEEAGQIIQSLDKLAGFVISFTAYENCYCIDNQQDVYLSCDIKVVKLPVPSESKKSAA